MKQESDCVYVFLIIKKTDRLYVNPLYFMNFFASPASFASIYESALDVRLGELCNNSLCDKSAELLNRLLVDNRKAHKVQIVAEKVVEVGTHIVLDFNGAVIVEREIELSDVCRLGRQNPNIKTAVLAPRCL